MHHNDKQKILSRYTERAELFGHGAAAIGEPLKRQPFYYYFMLPTDEFGPNDSILDVGCAYGDLLRYLKAIGWTGRYCGIDINPDLVAEGKARAPDSDLRVHDIQDEPLGEIFDWCFSCHVITSDTDDIPYLDHLQGMLEHMWAHTRKGILFNLLSPLVDYTNPIHARPKFSDVLAIVTRLTNRFSLRHDYMPFEFSLQLYKQNQVNRDSLIFSEHDALFTKVSDRWEAGNAK